MKITLTQAPTIETKPIKSKIYACNLVPTELTMALVTWDRTKMEVGDST